VAHAVGARNPSERDAVLRHSLLAAACVGAVLGVVGYLATPTLVELLGLEGPAALQAVAYLRTIYLGIVPLALAPVVDGVFIGIGNTLAPMALQGLAVLTNFTLNPLL